MRRLAIIHFQFRTFRLFIPGRREPFTPDAPAEFLHRAVRTGHRKHSPGSRRHRKLLELGRDLHALRQEISDHVLKSLVTKIIQRSVQVRIVETSQKFIHFIHAAVLVTFPAKFRNRNKGAFVRANFPGNAE